ncbi:MAG: hypothetical protein HN831_02940 [Waddliaceae bacterium]|mgnify:CR=1 FL=1|jgi:hypothetical protein|nr:hypothetical protein [Candidatus Jacksonbacteria bacterium]MBT7264418.1 hypothetical protein [Waddliaceae bacterium]MBT7461918.1 hypothetical protein [Waddliaceae bacterium]
MSPLTSSDPAAVAGAARVTEATTPEELPTSQLHKDCLGKVMDLMKYVDQRTKSHTPKKMLLIYTPSAYTEHQKTITQFAQDIIAILGPEAFTTQPLTKDKVSNLADYTHLFLLCTQDFSKPFHDSELNDQCCKLRREIKIIPTFPLEANRDHAHISVSMNKFITGIANSDTLHYFELLKNLCYKGPNTLAFFGRCVDRAGNVRKCEKILEDAFK